MAIAVPTELDVEELTRQAETLDRRSEQLRAQARELAQQAIDLRLEAERQTREPLRFVRPRVGVAPERDARLLTAVTDTLDQIGPCTSTILAEHLNQSKQRVYQALVHLEKSKAVKRSGVRRGTVWGIADDEDLHGHGAHASAYTLALGAGQKLGTFTLDEIDDELPMLTRAAVSRAVRELVADNKFTAEKVGRQKLYAFERPEHKPAPRPKHAPPEEKIVRLHQRRGYAIAGTGRAARPTDKDVAELFDQIKAAGAEIVRQDNGHWQVRLRDQVVEVLSGTPSDWRTLRNARARLRRAGIDI